MNPNNKQPLTSHSKISIAWIIGATLCLTGYYFARQWAVDQREETLEIRRRINDEFEEKLEESRVKLGKK